MQRLDSSKVRFSGSDENDIPDATRPSYERSVSLTDKTSAKDLLIHIGLLQIHRVYECAIGHFGGADGVHPEISSPDDPNFMVVVAKEGAHEEEGPLVVARLHTTQEGPFAVEFIIKPSNAAAEGAHEVKVLVEGNVMGKGQGTPLLKDGVKLIEKDSQCESDYPSEWGHGEAEEPDE